MKKKTYTILTGTKHETEVVEYNGEGVGPTTMITAGVHGDEVGGIRAAKGLVKTKGHVDCGRVVIVPEVHKVACDAGSRSGEGTDLNRVFSGQLTHPVAKALDDLFLEYEPDYLIDMHTALGLYRRDSPNKRNHPARITMTKGQQAFGNPGHPELSQAILEASQTLNRVLNLQNYKSGYDYSINTQHPAGVSPSIDGSDPMMADWAYKCYGIQTVLMEITHEEVPPATQASWYYNLLLYTLGNLGQTLWNVSKQEPAPEKGDDDVAPEPEPVEDPAEDEDPEPVEDAPKQSLIDTINHQVSKKLQPIKGQMAKMEARLSALESSLRSKGNQWPPETENDIPEDRIFHAVDDLGADPTGEEAIDPIFGKAMGGEGYVAIYFPEGRYRYQDFHPTADAVELYGHNASLVFDGEVHCDGNLNTAMNFRSNFGVVDGFEFDFTECAPAPTLKFQADNWTLRNISIVGDVGVRDWPQHMEAGDNGKSLFHFASTAKDGHAVVERLYAVAMTKEQFYAGEDTFVDTYNGGKATKGLRDNRRAMWIPPANSSYTHEGTLTVKDSWFEGWTENTLYGEYAPGKMVIDNCYVHDSPIGLRAPNGSVIKNTTIVKDGPVPWMRESLWDQYGENANPGTNRMRGLMVRADHYYDSSLEYRVENCDIVIADDTNFDAGQPIVMTALPGKTVFKDVRIKLRQRQHEEQNDRHDRWNAIKVDGGAVGVGNGEMVFDGVHIDSDSEKRVAIKIDQQAKITKFEGVVNCPAGRMSLAEGDLLDCDDNMRVGTPKPADATPPILPPPEKGKTADGRRELA